jgi:membrane protease YdiL (CAAX protease family)
LVAWTKIRGGKRPSVGIFLLTIAYAATATLTMTLLQDHRVVVSGPTDIALLATISANLVILAPCAEELFFRGWLYTALRYRLSFWPSYLLTATLFAAIHWDPNHRRIFLVLPLALALGLLREITGSIKPTIALHGLYNLIIVAITLLEA